MQGEDDQSPSMDAQIRMALAHPKRTEIFGRLIREKDGTSEDELADEFGMSIPLVTYHLKVLHDADLIARLDDEQEPGTERSYIATPTL
jgi:DNA-binding transcriptional ArsR family regulator